jgi:hypothetical protein
MCTLNDFALFHVDVFPCSFLLRLYLFTLLAADSLVGFLAEMVNQQGVIDFDESYILAEVIGLST